MKQMKSLLLLPILINRAFAIDLTEVDGKFPCPEISNSHECAVKHEEIFKKRNSDLFLKNNHVLYIKLKSGKHISIANDHDRLNVLEIVSSFLVIREQYWEGNTWHILDLRTGKRLETKCYPLLSPKGDKMVCAQRDLDADHSPNILDIYTINTKGLKKIFSADTNNEPWGPGNVRWIDNETVSFSKFQINPNIIQTGILYIEEPYLLKNINGLWKLMLNKV